MSGKDWQCANCGTRQVWTGSDPRVCRNCGGVKAVPARPGTISSTRPEFFRKRRYLLGGLLSLVLVVVVLMLTLWPKRQPGAQAAPIVDGRSTVTIGTGSQAPGSAPPDPPPVPEKAVSVGETRIVTVTNPRIRVLPEGGTYDVNDLLRTANSPTAAFDVRQLQIVEPRRMQDQMHQTVYLGEIVNTSTTQTVVAPKLSVSLMRGGQRQMRGEHPFPDIPPGAHVPLFFALNGRLDFDSVHFEWKPAQAYPASDATHAHVHATVSTHDLSQGTTTSIGDNPGVFHYPWMEVTGNVTNQGEVVARGVSVYLMLRDASGRIIGYHREELNQDIPAGDSLPFKVGTAPWGASIAAIDVIAVPTSPPS